MRILYFILISLNSLGAYSKDLNIFNGLSSHETLPYTWDILLEIEHKETATVLQSSSCITPEELISYFPKSSTSGDYWSWLSKQPLKNKSINILGNIKSTTIYEAVYNFKQPGDFLKILAFKADDSQKICPFLVISECCNQLNYSTSQIVNEIVVTKMQDNVAAGQGKPTVMDFSFKFENGLPIKETK